MKKQINTATKWLQLIDKDKLQSFQDNFARAHGVSMVFYDLKGHPVTVCSQASLFCHAISQKNHTRCLENRENDRLSVIESEKPLLHICPFGISCIYVPIFFKDTPVAYAMISGFTYTTGSFPETLRQRYHVPEYPKDKAIAIMELLNSVLKLLDMNTSVLLPNGEQGYENGRNQRSRDDRISKRESEIVQLVCKGLTNRAIGEQLSISETTVKTHISNILAKLNLKDRMQIIVHYYQKNQDSDASSGDAEN